MPNTIVTGQLTDNYGLVWSNAKIQISFQPNPDQPGPYCFDGDCGTAWQSINNGVSDGAGNFTASLPSNNDIAPAGSMWRFAISPNADAPSVILVLPISGPTQDISTQFKVAVTNYITQSLAVPRSYAVFTTTSEPPDDGQLIFDTTNQQFYYWSAGNWNLLVASAPPGTGFVQFLPPGAQTITQPPNTNFTINLSGGGEFHVAGGPSVAQTTDPAGFARFILQTPTIEWIWEVGGASAAVPVPGALYLFASNDSKFVLQIIDAVGTTLNTPLNIMQSFDLSVTNVPLIHAGIRVDAVSGDLIMSAHGTGTFGGKTRLNWDSGGGTVFGNGAQTAVAVIDTGGNGTFGPNALIIGGLTALPTATLGAIAMHSANLYLDAPIGPGGVILNSNGATGGVRFGTGVGFVDNTGNAGFNGSVNVGALTVAGAAPTAFMLVGNGTSYIPQPISNFLNKVTVQDYSSGGRAFGDVHQNPSLTGFLLVSGTGRTNGGSVGSTQALIGSTNSTVTTQAWGMTGAATISQGVIGFFFVVPPQWFYTVVANTLSTGPGGGNAVFAVGNWIETLIGG